jgi:hypothetical protein
MRNMALSACSLKETFSSELSAQITFGPEYGQSLSWSFRDRPLHPVVSLLGGISTGDTNPASHVLQTFNPLFPSGLYYGYIDSTGSPNAIVLHPELSLTISPTVSISARHFSFWRTSAADGIYSQPGFFLRAGNENQSRIANDNPSVSRLIAKQPRRPEKRDEHRGPRFSKSPSCWSPAVQ